MPATGSATAGATAGGTATQQGTDGDDNLLGVVNAADTIFGGAGNDKVMGYEGNDTLYGGAGNDLIAGGTGDDIIHGGAGHDQLYGNGLQSSYGQGESDEDTFVYEPGGGTDTIMDFVNGEDVIDLSAFSNITQFSDLSISQDGNFAVIDFGGSDKIRLSQFNVDDLDASDFVFADDGSDGV